MPRRPTRTVPTVLLPGPIGDRPEDWPQWLAGQLTGAGREVRLCSAPDLAEPRLVDWQAALRTTLAGLEPDRFDVVAHSLGCLLWLHHALDPQDAPRPARVALVAPPAVTDGPPAWSSFYPVPLAIDPNRQAADRTALVGSDDDPYCPGGVAQVYGTPLKMATTMISGAGSLTAESGYGPWPAVLDWCGRDNLAFIA
ncbi:MAG: alpha/beta hydrolase [Actinomycetota bacterium]|nr:alpha/beta hydrolase [Actinomycetota bacterium]